MIKKNLFKIMYFKEEVKKSHIYINYNLQLEFESALR